MKRLLDAVIFDWGGTLSVHADVDLADLWRHAAAALDPAREDELTAMLARVEAGTWRRVAEDQMSFTLDRILDEACRATGLDVRAAVRRQAATAHLDSWTPHISHVPDALPVLQALQEAGYRCGMLSNTHWPRPFHEHFLERDGLAPYLDATAYTSELPRTKPHPSAFKAVLHLLDVPDARRAVFVGDRLFDDIYGASQMGMRTALVRNPAVRWPGGTVVRPGEVRPDAEVDTLSEVLRWVADWS
ncbi:MAG: HAD family hydrolase [Acidimicrobiales bacterium]